MSSFELEQTIPEILNPRFFEFEVKRTAFENQLTERLQNGDRTVLGPIQEMYGNYLDYAIKPDESKYCYEDGSIRSEIIVGVSQFCANEVAMSRIATISNTLAQKHNGDVEVTITRDFPITAIRMMELFHRNYLQDLAKSCYNGIVEGWNMVLSLLAREDMLLQAYPNSLPKDLVKESREIAKGRFSLPTDFEGMDVVFDYNSQFCIPDISVVVKP